MAARRDRIGRLPEHMQRPPLRRPTAQRGATWPPSRPQVTPYRTRRRSRPQARRRRPARDRAHPEDRAAADGRRPHRAHPAQGQPEGRLRLPGLRLARGRQAAHRRVLRERRQGGRRGGHAAPGHPGVLRRAPARRPGHALRVLAGPAGPDHAPDVPAGGRRPVQGGQLGAGLRDHRRGADGPRLPRRGPLLHLGPHQQRGRVPLPAVRPRVRHQQPARLLQHVPRVLGLRTDRDHRHRQGQRLPRRPPPGRPDHRRRAEPGHQPPAHALRPGEGQVHAARRSSR